MSEQKHYSLRKYVFDLAFIRGLIAHGVLRANIKKFVVLTMLAILLSGCGLPTAVNNTQKAGKDEYIKGAVIKGFPNMPLFSGAKVVESYGLDGKYGANFTTSKDLVKVVNFYGPALNQLGWEYTLHQKDKTNYVYDVTNMAYSGSVIVNTAADGKTTAITVYVGPR